MLCLLPVYRQIDKSRVFAPLPLLIFFGSAAKNAFLYESLRVEIGLVEIVCGLQLCIITSITVIEMIVISLVCKNNRLLIIEQE